MEKSKTVLHYISCFIIMLLIFGILSATALAKDGTGTSNATSNDTEDKKPLETFQKKELITEKAHKNSQTENGTQEREQLKEGLKIQKNNYQTSRQNFLAIRKQLRSGDYGEKELEITRTYLISSIDYMIAHLEKVQYNLEQSNGNDTETRIATIEDRISQLQKEKEAIESVEDLEDFTVAVKSVRGIWNNVKNSVDTETGKTASEKIDKCVDKSETFSNKLGKEIESMKATGINTTALESKLSSYNALMDAAREKNDEAKKIYNKENATSAELQKANGYLQSTLIDLKNANLILKELFGELKQYRIERNNETKVKNILNAGLNNSENANNTNNNSSVVSVISRNEKKTYPKGGINSNSGNKSEDIYEDRSED